MAVTEFRESPLIYLILTYSGKPVFFSQGVEEEVVRYTGVIQAIISFFDKNSDLRLIQSDSSQIVVLNAYPLVIVAIDRQKRGVHQLKSHLDMFHAQILSVLTKRQLEKQFDAKPGVDLRSMLGGTEVFLKGLVADFSNSEPWTWLGALECLELRRSTRTKFNTTLLESRDQNSLLYGLMVSDWQLSGVLRPKQHSLHPPDLHLLFSMLFNTTSFSEGENWVPICFPKFNPNGFLYAYIQLVTPPNTYLVLVGPDKHGFFGMQSMAREILRRMEPSLILTINEATDRGRVKCSRIGIEPIQYFVYKSNSHVQFIQSKMESGTPENVKLLFAQLQASMSQKRQRICWYKYEKGSILGWHTPAFELYCFVNDSSTEEEDAKDVVSNSVKKLVGWIRKHETRLFIVDGATF